MEVFVVSIISIVITFSTLKTLKGPDSNNDKLERLDIVGADPDDLPVFQVHWIMHVSCSSQDQLSDPQCRKSESRPAPGMSNSGSWFKTPQVLSSDMSFRKDISEKTYQTAEASRPSAAPYARRLLRPSAGLLVLGHRWRQRPLDGRWQRRRQLPSSVRLLRWRRSISRCRLSRADATKLRATVAA